MRAMEVCGLESEGHTPALAVEPMEELDDEELGVAVEGDACNAREVAAPESRWACGGRRRTGRGGRDVSWEGFGCHAFPGDPRS